MKRRFMDRVIWGLTSIVLVPSLIFGQAVPSSTSPVAGGGSGVPGQLQFTAGTVLVRYVAGTLPADPTNRREMLGKLGCLVATKDALVFVKYRRQSHVRRLGGFIAHMADPSLAKGAGQCAHADAAHLLPIEYAKMQLLARGQVQNMSSASASDFQLVSGIGSLAGAAVLNSKAGYIGLGTVAGTSFAFYLNRRTQNYITVFIGTKNAEPEKTISGLASLEPRKQDSGTVYPGKFSITLPKAEETEDYFSECEKKCDFVVFQVIDGHDYWNTSMMLNAMTGKTFVAESAEKGSGSSSSK